MNKEKWKIISWREAWNEGYYWCLLAINHTLHPLCMPCVSFSPSELENIVTIRASQSTMFAGSSFTLNCTVMADFYPVVEWTGPDGSSVRNTSSIAVNAPVYNGNKTHLLLRFSALRTSQAGSYSCLSIINSPLSVKTATKDVVVTGKRHCKYYTSAGTMVTQCRVLI